MLVAGIMSGTSADAIDVALVEITGAGWKTRYMLVGFTSSKYPPAVRKRILAVAAAEPPGALGAADEVEGALGAAGGVEGALSAAGEVSQLNFLLGELYAKAVRAACRRARVPIERLRLIGSHGQTIFHQGRPSNYCGFPVRSTLQIGEPAIIAERTGVTTIADFRPADIAAGGQGAPLVPFFDYLSYRHPRRGRIALNIGGIANLTAIPAGGSPEDVIAFDTGPGNMLLDALASRITGGKLAYDRGGRLASQGRIEEAHIGRLLRQPYFRAKPPKSAGREQFGAQYLAEHFLKPLGSSLQQISRQQLLDVIATAASFTAEAIALAVADFVLPKFPIHECIVSGGGSKNAFVMDQLRRRLQQRGDIRVLSDAAAARLSSTTAAAKEAVAFAVLAYQSYHRLPANVPSATGARHAAVLGKIVYACQ